MKISGMITALSRVLVSFCSGGAVAAGVGSGTKDKQTNLLLKGVFEVRNLTTSL